MRFAVPPLFDNKNPLAKSVFEPSALLREARRQKGLATVSVPSVCVLDPDGDIVRRLKATGQAHLAKDWPCYHEEAIAVARSKGILAVEMEAAALYAFARVRKRKVLCLAHVTNTMAVADQDFEKGEADGTIDALRVLEAIISEMSASGP